MSIPSIFEVQSFLADGEEEIFDEPSLLDNVSSEAVYNIFRWMSARPRSKNWMSYLKLEDVEKMYFCNGHLPAQLREVVEHVTNERNCGGNYLTVSENFQKLKRVLSIGGPCIQSLVLTSPIPGGAEAKRILASLPALKSLDITKLRMVKGNWIFDGFFECAPPTLEELSLPGCVPAWNLDKMAPCVKNLKVLVVHGCRSKFKTFLAAVGPELESLTVTEMDCALFIKEIPAMCPRLTKLSISLVSFFLPRVFNPAVLEAFVTYGAQLEKLNTSGLTLRQYQELAKRCPAADCSVDCILEELADVTAGLGERLVHLTLLPSEGQADILAVERAAAHCHRLKSLKWTVPESGHEVVEALLTAGGNNLQALEVNGNPNRATMRALENSLSSVRELQYDAKYYPEMFKAFAMLNTRLAVVDIAVSSLDVCGEAVSLDILKSFEVCCALRELYLNIRWTPIFEKLPLIVDALVPYRAKGTFVSICDVVYLPSSIARRIEDAPLRVRRTQRPASEGELCFSRTPLELAPTESLRTRAHRHCPFQRWVETCTIM